MKYILIGDIHGKLEIVETMLSSFPDHIKVFVGDYLDSFDRSPDACVQCLQMVLDAIKSREDVIGLIGNHEWSYLERAMICSGYNETTQALVNSIGHKRILDTLKKYLWIDENVLVTHAGASKRYFETIEELKDCLENDKGLKSIGYSRGGGSVCGGIYWCDYWNEYEDIPGITQVCGHSAYRPYLPMKSGGELERYPEGIVKVDHCWNIDCLDRVFEVLEYNTETKQFSIINMKGGEYHE